MELEEFVRLDPGKIRRDKELMQLFVSFYKAAFSFEPNCAGCVFKSGFRKLQRFANNDGKSVKFEKNTVNMTTKKTTFELKSKYRLKILTYRKDEKTYRSYGYNLTEEFARELIASGKSDLFVTLPSAAKEIQEIQEKVIVKMQMTDGSEENYEVNNNEVEAIKPSSTSGYTLSDEQVDKIKDFDKLVEDERGKVLKSKGLNKFDVMDWKNEILPLYAKAKERTGKQAKSRKKADVIAFLEEHES